MNKHNHTLLVQLSDWPQFYNLWYYAKYMNSMCLAQPANVVSTQSASSNIPKNGTCMLHPIMAETTGEQSIQQVRVWHYFCQRESEKLDVSGEHRDLWPCPRGSEPRGDVRASRLSGHRRRFVHTSRRRGRKHNSCTFLRCLWWKCAVEVQRQQTRYTHVLWQQSNG